MTDSFLQRWLAFLDWVAKSCTSPTLEVQSVKVSRDWVGASDAAMDGGGTFCDIGCMHQPAVPAPTSPHTRMACCHHHGPPPNNNHSPFFCPSSNTHHLPSTCSTWPT